MITVYEAIDKILEKINLEQSTGTMNKYIKGFDIALEIHPDDENLLVDQFNLGNAGKIQYIYSHSGVAVFSWAPTLEDLNHREYHR